MTTTLNVLVVATTVLAMGHCPGTEGGGPMKTAPSLTSPFTTVRVSGIVIDNDDVPIAGVTVGAWGYTATTGGDGKFELSLFTVPNPTVELLASGPACLVKTVSVANAGTAPVEIRTTRVHPLPIDATETATLRPSDPPSIFGTEWDYMGAHHTRYYRFTTQNEDVSVELTWDRSGNADLKMWAYSGTVTSQPMDDGEIVRLSRNKTDLLAVVQKSEAGRLAAPVTFTLRTRTVR